MGSCRKRYTWRLSVRIGAFNLENLFDRAKALNLGSWSEGKPILDAYARLNALFTKATYSPADKKKIVDGLTALGLDKRDGGGDYVILRQNRGRLLKRPRSGAPEVVAKVTQAGVFRKGVWGGKNGTLFEHYDTITKAEEAASDHAAIWVDVDV